MIVRTSYKSFINFDEVAFFYKKLLPIAVPPYPCVEQQNGSYRKWSVWLCDHCVKFSADSKRSHFFGWKRGWPYRRTQAWASYEKWPVGLCEHRVKFLSISTRSHISRKIVFCLHFECCCFYYFRLYHLHYALNREVPIMKNAQYSHATILRYCMEKSKRSHILKIDRRTAVPVRWTAKL